MGQPRWEHFRHDADIGVRGIGNSMAEAFEQAACALSAVITELPAANGACSCIARARPVAGMDSG